MDQRTFEVLSEVLREPILLLDRDGEVLVVTRRAADLFGCAVDQIRGRSLASLVEGSTESVDDHLKSASRTSASVPGSVRITAVNGDEPSTYRTDTVRVAIDGEPFSLLMRLRSREVAVREFSELRTKIDELAAEIHERRRVERLIESQKCVLENILVGRPLSDTFDELLTSLEDVAPTGMAGSILVLDEERKRLLHLSAPSLPPEYNEAIDGIEIGPVAGSCGTAAYRNEPVVVSDIETDPLWAPWRELALSHGLRACWSTPIPSRDGNVLGTFAMYFRKPRMPSTADREMIDLVTRTAAIGIESRRSEQKTRAALGREKRARAEAENANRLKGEFLATVSHELRTPLTSILGWTTLLRNSPSQAELDEGLLTVEGSARAQSQLVDDLLDISRTSVGRMKIERTAVDLISVVRSAAATVRPVASARHVSVEVKIPDSIPPVMGDPRRLHQIVWNLLTNAIKFSPAEGVVRVTIEEKGERAVISVADEGKGIDPEFLPRLFSRFSQEESVLTRSQGGMGLGLSIVKDLVELHGGEVRVESQPGQGACFYIEFPLAEWGTESEPYSDVELKLEGTELENVRILIVEDDLATREFLVALFHRAGAITTVAGSVKEALECWAQSTPQVLVCDLGLPEATGIDLIREINAERRPRPQVAIAISAYLREAQGQEALATGFDTFMSKPVESDVLIAEIRKGLGRVDSQ